MQTAAALHLSTVPIRCHRDRPRRVREFARAAVVVTYRLVENDRAVLVRLGEMNLGPLLGRSGRSDVDADAARQFDTRSVDGNGN